MSTAPAVAVFVRDTTPAFPEAVAGPDERQKVAPAVDMMSLAEVLTKQHDTDAHFVAYVGPLPMRLCMALFDREQRESALARRVLTLDVRAAAMAAEYTVEMTAFVADVDDPVAHAQGIPARDEWRALERSKIEALLHTHPGAFVYETKGGYRILFLLAVPFQIVSRDDAAKWTRRYRLLCASLARRFGIIPDPACSDWPRCFRAPYVLRDGKREARPTAGDPHAIGVIDYEPIDEDAATARQFAVTDGRWRVDETPRTLRREGGHAPYSDDERAPLGDGSDWNLDGEPVKQAIELIARHFPKMPWRHEFAMALAGMLRRADATERDAYQIIYEGFKRGGSSDPATRAKITESTWSLASPRKGFDTAVAIIGEAAAKEIGDLFTRAHNDAFLSPTFGRSSTTKRIAARPGVVHPNGAQPAQLTYHRGIIVSQQRNGNYLPIDEKALHKARTTLLALRRRKYQKHRLVAKRAKAMGVALKLDEKQARNAVDLLLLDRMLEGEALVVATDARSDEGSIARRIHALGRDGALKQVVGLLAFALSKKTPLETIGLLVRRSVNEMLVKGVESIDPVALAMMATAENAYKAALVRRLVKKRERVTAQVAAHKYVVSNPATPRRS